VKIFFTSSLLIINTIVFGQVTIVSSNLPQANDILVTQAATLTGGVDEADTGANHEWNFGDDILQLSGQMTNITCYDVANTPFVYQFLFNNPFDPNHNSDFAQGIEEFSVATLQFSNVYQYFKNGAGKYAITGLGASINDVPLASQKNEIEVLFELPLEFGASGESDSDISFEVPTFGAYQQELNRVYSCDGWGTLNILDQTYEVLRLRSVVNAEDSIYVDFIQNGLAFSRPEVITYEWWSPLFNVPVLAVTYTNEIVTSVQVADIYNVGPISVEDILQNEISLYPNPCKDLLWIKISNGTIAQIQLFDVNGKLVVSESNNAGVVDLSSYPSGLFTIKIITSNGVQTSKIVKY